MRIKLLVDGILAEDIRADNDHKLTLPILQRLDRELARRGNVYRDLGVRDSAGYRNSGQAVAMPVLLLSIDTFNDFIFRDDRISLEVSMLLDRLIRQGEALDLHVKFN
jgi:DNA segregation ATPase FtsK/SpoIIIE-like protein